MRNEGKPNDVATVCDRRRFPRPSPNPAKNRHEQSRKIKANRTQSDLLGPKTLGVPFFSVLLPVRLALRNLPHLTPDPSHLMLSVTPFPLLGFFGDFWGFLVLYFFSASIEKIRVHPWNSCLVFPQKLSNEPIFPLSAFPLLHSAFILLPSPKIPFLPLSRA